MTKEVTIQIDGYQLGEAKEQISVMVAGTYRKINGNHYIHYKEAADDGEDGTNNTIKLTSDSIEMTKSGASNTKMVFDTAKLTQTCYNTPYGSFCFDIHTTQLLLEEQPEQIHAELHYHLSSGDQLILENQVKIMISSVKGDII